MFNKKPRISLSALLKGIQQAVNSAQEMLQAQQASSVARMLQGQQGCPVTQKVTVGDREMEVPLMAILPQGHIALEDVEIKFNAKVSDVAAESLKSLRGQEIPHADLGVTLEGVKASAGDTMQITLRFRQQTQPEGLSRLLDEYNKLI